MHIDQADLRLDKFWILTTQQNKSAEEMSKTRIKETNQQTPFKPKNKECAQVKQTKWLKCGLYPYQKWFSQKDKGFSITFGYVLINAHLQILFNPNASNRHS